MEGGSNGESAIAGLGSTGECGVVTMISNAHIGRVCVLGGLRRGSKKEKVK